MLILRGNIYDRIFQLLTYDFMIISLSTQANTLISFCYMQDLNYKSLICLQETLLIEVNRTHDTHSILVYLPSYCFLF